VLEIRLGLEKNAYVSKLLLIL